MPASYNVTARTDSEETTKQLGRLLGECLQPGSVVSLKGNLGAGKTRFIQGIASALGVNEQDVTSPTFSLVQEYAGRIPIYHFDTYRLRDSDEFEELGAPEMLESPAVSLLEWGDRMADYLPETTLWISIQILTESTREFHIEARAASSIELLQEFEAKLPQ